MARRQRETRLPAPYLKTACISDPDAGFPDGYPFALPWLTSGFSIEFNTPVTILMGENGTG